MDDVALHRGSSEHLGTITGNVQCDALGGKLDVQQGWFNLFVDANEDGEERKLMKYRLLIADGEDHPITLNGFKEVRDDKGFDVWSDTTTLFTRILSGHVEPGADDDTPDVLASGIPYVLPQDFAVQLTTFRVDPPHRLDALGRFGALFAGSLWEALGPVRRRTPDLIREDGAPRTVE